MSSEVETHRYVSARGSTTFADWAKDALIATGLSKFTAAAIPDMSTVDSQQERWLANSILNNLSAILQVEPRRRS